MFQLIAENPQADRPSGDRSPTAHTQLGQSHPFLGSRATRTHWLACPQQLGEGFNACFHYGLGGFRKALRTARALGKQGSSRDLRQRWKEYNHQGLDLILVSCCLIGELRMQAEHFSGGRDLLARAQSRPVPPRASSIVAMVMASSGSALARKPRCW
jgi:hypothetical protein